VSEAKAMAAPQVTFYTKAGCHLCEDAREMLDDIATMTVFELTEIDIRGNLEVFAKYRYRIPVIVVDENTIIEGRIEFSDLARALHADQK
jgi:glutaredoxin